jgi:hypothetical protein
LLSVGVDTAGAGSAEDITVLLAAVTPFPEAEEAIGVDHRATREAHGAFHPVDPTAGEVSGTLAREATTMDAASLAATTSHAEAHTGLLPATAAEAAITAGVPTTTGGAATDMGVVSTWATTVIPVTPATTTRITAIPMPIPTGALPTIRTVMA